MLRITVRTAAPLLIAVAAGRSPVTAQQASRGTAWSDLRVEQPAAALPVHTTPLSAEPQPAGAQTTRRSSTRRRVLHLIGGAVVGSGIGYFASQVKYSDWDKKSDSDFVGQRALFAGGGAGVGALLGLMIGTRPGDLGPPSAPAFPGMGARSAAPVSDSRNAPLGVEDVRRSGATNAYEIVQSLRPLWLVERGPKSQTEMGRIISYDRNGAEIAPGEATIKVYLDGAKLGGVETLRQIAASTVRSIEYLDPAAAAHRFGMGVAHGAILVTTAGS